MLVKIITSICGIEVGRFVTVAPERGSAWIARGFAQGAGPSDKETTPAEKVEAKASKPGRPFSKKGL
jgi:hypothetical protein